MSSCRNCGAAITWLKTKNGKNIPVNPETVADGDVTFDRQHHVTHFDTCPARQPDSTPRQ